MGAFSLLFFRAYENFSDKINSFEDAKKVFKWNYGFQSVTRKLTFYISYPETKILLYLFEGSKVSNERFSDIKPFCWPVWWSLKRKESCDWAA